MEYDSFFRADLQNDTGDIRFVSVGGSATPLIKRLAAQTGLYMSYKWGYYNNPRLLQSLGELIVDPLHRRFSNRVGSIYFSAREIDRYRRLTLIP